MIAQAGAFVKWTKTMNYFQECRLSLVWNGSEYVPNTWLRRLDWKRSLTYFVIGMLVMAVGLALVALFVMRTR